ncbi:MAG: PhoH family protein [Legionellales bacterium]|nr:PhoH family protein [Legionellales bacterium]
MSTIIQSKNVSLTPIDNRRLASLCGQCDEHLRQLERQLGIQIHNRGNIFQITGSESSVKTASDILVKLYNETASAEALTPDKIHLILQEFKTSPKRGNGKTPPEEITIPTKKGLVKARSKNQRAYLQNIMKYDINFGIGPAGTGKTYLAVACAIDALEQDSVRRLVLVRPAVEAGERLGFLPGDLAQKVDPYLKPLYDALYEMLGAEKVTKLMERHIIEIAPLAYMRGRTLNDSFIILDESQNTTVEQMKMFLTRIGFGSRAVITGDISQIDLPRGVQSGLIQAMSILNNIKGISFTQFAPSDIVRHPLVQDIVRAYDKHEKNADM